MPVCSVAPSGTNDCDVLGDRPLDVARRRVVDRERLAVALDEDVDLVDVEGVPVVGRQSRGARVTGSAPRRRATARGRRRRDAVRPTDAPGVQRQAAPPVAVGRRRGSAHHAGRHRLEQRSEAAEVGGREADVGAAVAEQPLDRAVEPAEVVDVRVGEQLGQHRQQRAGRRAGPPSRCDVRALRGMRRAGPGRVGCPSVSTACTCAAASSAVTTVATAVWSSAASEGAPACPPFRRTVPWLRVGTRPRRER